jgi:hypothetical protein
VLDGYDDHMNRKLIYCRDCKVKASHTEEGRAAIEKSAHYLQEPLVRKPLPKVKLRKRRGRKAALNKKPLYVIRCLELMLFAVAHD